VRQVEEGLARGECCVDDCYPFSGYKYSLVRMSCGLCQFRQEYWRGLPFPLPGDLPDREIESISPALAGRFFYHCVTLEALYRIYLIKN